MCFKLFSLQLFSYVTEVAKIWLFMVAIRFTAEPNIPELSYGGAPDGVPAKPGSS